MANSSDVPMEQQIEQLKKQLEQMQKLTALGELVSTTTHEFNNVLMTVINYAKLGIAHKDTATRDKALDKILTAANRAAKITNGILGVARNRKPGREPTSLATLLDDCLLLLERELNKYRISVERYINDVPEAYVNANQIQQVLLNMVINARQAMRNGGRIVVKLTYDEKEDMIHLMIRDFGSGIPADKLPHIFDAFFSTKSGPDESGKGGTGLGLSMCREIIESHQGRIRVESTVKRGTAFTLMLPTAAKMQNEKPKTPQVIGMPIDCPELESTS